MQNQSQTTPILKTNNLEISVYRGELTKGCLIEQSEKIMKAFPKFAGTISILKERLKANGFTDERLKAAVDHVIDTYTGFGKEPNIADFIQYDKKVKVYTYNEIIAMEGSGDKFARFTKVNIGLEKPRWALTEEVEFYKLKKWE